MERNILHKLLRAKLLLNCAVAALLFVVIQACIEAEDVLVALIKNALPPTITSSTASYVSATFVVSMFGLALGYLRLRISKQAHTDQKGPITSLRNALTMHDADTADHSCRVADFTAAVLREMNISGDSASTIVLAAQLHDIGKIAVPSHILQKDQPLTPEEWAVVQTHPVCSAELLADVPGMEEIAGIVRYHHERWDGGGYPMGLKGPAIPLGARIIAVTDSFDAMTTERPYKRAMQVEKAVQILRQGRGEQWDPLVVDAFISTFDGHVERPTKEISYIQARAGSPHHKWTQSLA